MARVFERYRRQIIEVVSEHLKDANDSRAARMVRRICRHYDVPATDRDIQDAATEAVRRRLVAKAKEIINGVEQLHDALIAQADELTALNAKMDQARQAFLALKAKVDSYHP